jgi:hypothetical protein
MRYKLAQLILCLAIGATQGCARPDVVRHTDSPSNSPTGEQNLPFHQDPDRTTDDNVHPDLPADGKPVSGPPFLTASHSRSLPTGALITVRLENSLSISQTRPGDSFTALVAGPLNLEGGMLIHSGTPVIGRVEFVQPSSIRPGLAPDPGYLRLALNTITIDGRALELQTSSLFAKGTIQAAEPSMASSVGGGVKSRSGEFRIQKGRRLTFRLTAPVTVADPSALAKRQDPNSSAQ